MSVENKKPKAEKLTAVFKHGAELKTVSYERVLKEDGTISHYIQDGKEVKSIIFKKLDAKVEL